MWKGGEEATGRIDGINIAALEPKAAREPLLRIKILQKPPTSSIEGIRLDRFEPGFLYEVGNTLGALLLAE